MDGKRCFLRLLLGVLLVEERIIFEVLTVGGNLNERVMLVLKLVKFLGLVQ